jgi:2-C-methyl-D-erythritol 4-phosphate cytidylyltransferase
MNSAIIVAAGSGKRFGADVAKQFLEIEGKPVVVYALERFEFCPQIDEIILVLPVSEIESFSNRAPKYNLKKLTKIVAGGDTRAASVRNGFDAVDAARCEIVAVHDGARPLVSVEEISKIIACARETGAACLVADVTDTIKEVEGGVIARTIERSRLRRALTPQAFRYEILKRALHAGEQSDAAISGIYDTNRLRQRRSSP